MIGSRVFAGDLRPRRTVTTTPETKTPAKKRSRVFAGETRTTPDGYDHARNENAKFQKHREFSLGQRQTVTTTPETKTPTNFWLGCGCSSVAEITPEDFVEPRFPEKWSVDSGTEPPMRRRSPFSSAPRSLAWFPAPKNWRRFCSGGTTRNRPLLCASTQSNAHVPCRLKVREGFRVHTPESRSERARSVSTKSSRRLPTRASARHPDQVELTPHPTQSPLRPARPRARPAHARPRRNGLHRRCGGDDSERRRS